MLTSEAWTGSPLNLHQSLSISPQSLSISINLYQSPLNLYQSPLNLPFHPQNQAFSREARLKNKGHEGLLFLEIFLFFAKNFALGAIFFI
jgi:hypothetical protein